MPKSILVADDNSYFRRRLVESLRADARIRIAGEAENGLEAVQKAQALRPDLIIMDMSMPRMNGIEAARRLKKTELSDIPIILFAAHEEAASFADISSTGIRAVVSKSDGLDKLKAQIESLLGDEARS